MSYRFAVPPNGPSPRERLMDSAFSATIQLNTAGDSVHIEYTISGGIHRKSEQASELLTDLLDQLSRNARRVADEEGGAE